MKQTEHPIPSLSDAQPYLIPPHQPHRIGLEAFFGRPFRNGKKLGGAGLGCAGLGLAGLGQAGLGLDGLGHSGLGLAGVTLAWLGQARMG